MGKKIFGLNFLLQGPRVWWEDTGKLIFCQKFPSIGSPGPCQSLSQFWAVWKWVSQKIKFLGFFHDFYALKRLLTMSQCVFLMGKLVLTFETAYRGHFRPKNVIFGHFTYWRLTLFVLLVSKKFQVWGVNFV